MKSTLFSLLALLLLAIAPAGCRSASQATDNSGSELTSAQKKILKARQDSIEHAISLEALKSQNFVLEASRMQVKQGEIVLVTPMTNFVAVDGEKITIQVAPYNSGGPNGIGGITLNGRVSNVRFSTDSRGNATMTLNAIGTALSATLAITLPSSGTNAAVNISPNYNSLDVTLTGNLLPTARSVVHKGNSI